MMLILELAWYSWIAVYIVGFMVSVFLWTLFIENNEITAPLSILWPFAIPIVLLFVVGAILYYGPEWLAIKCREAIAKWGK